MTGMPDSHDANFADWNATLQQIEAESPSSFSELPSLVSPPPSGLEQQVKDLLQSLLDPLTAGLEKLFSWFQPQGSSETSKWLLHELLSNLPTLLKYLAYIALAVIIVLIVFYLWKALQTKYELGQFEKPTTGKHDVTPRWKQELKLLETQNNYSSAARLLWRRFLYEEKRTASLTPKEYLQQKKNLTAELALELYPLMFGNKPQPDEYRRFQSRILHDK